MQMLGNHLAQVTDAEAESFGVAWSCVHEVSQQQCHLQQFGEALALPKLLASGRHCHHVRLDVIHLLLKLKSEEDGGQTGLQTLHWTDLERDMHMYLRECFWEVNGVLMHFCKPKYGSFWILYLKSIIFSSMVKYLKLYMYTTHTFYRSAYVCVFLTTTANCSDSASSSYSSFISDNVFICSCSGSSFSKLWKHTAAV